MIEFIYFIKTNIIHDFNKIELLYMSIFRTLMIQYCLGRLDIDKIIFCYYGKFREIIQIGIYG